MIGHGMPSEPAWHKSSSSQNNGCVEVAVTAEHVLVRDTKDRPGPVLRFTPVEWEAFLAGVRQGEFDLSGGGA